MRIFVFFGAILFLILNLAVANAYELKWEVVQPFKFLRYESDHKIHEIAFKEASKLSGFKNSRISSMENLLNDIKWWNTRIDSDATPLQAIEIIRKSSVENNFKKGRGALELDPRLGWGSFLRTKERPSRGTCWNADQQTFKGCLSSIGDFSGDGYVNPKSHVVKIKLMNAPDGFCDFKIEGTAKVDNLYLGFLDTFPLPNTTNVVLKKQVCSREIFARVAFKHKYILHVKKHNGDSIDHTSIKVKDYVIVSLGDSYASGEGNPDVPALLDPLQTISPAYNLQGLKVDGRSVPRRKGVANGEIGLGTSARWIDRRCHRSIYSAHTRAAIALALSGAKHHAITYLTFACSGAEITDGLFWAQDGQECVLSHKNIEPQFSEVIKALGDPNKKLKFSKFRNVLNSKDRFKNEHLKFARARSNFSKNRIKRELDACKGWPGKLQFSHDPILRNQTLLRKPDLVMLSIGGNDLGFVNLIAKSTINPKFFDIPFVGSLANKIFEKGAISNSELERRLSDDLEPRFNMLKNAFSKKLEMTDLGDVLITQFPTMLKDENGFFCKSSRKGMTSSSLLGIHGPEDNRTQFSIDKAQGFADKLNKKIKKFQEKSGYTLVNSHIPKFEKHGICANGVNNETAPTANFYDLPQYDGNNWIKNAGKNFDPTQDFYPYAPRQRYFRTFNDAYLLVQYFKRNAYEEPAKLAAKSKYLAYRSIGGVFHPTAEGNAITADAIYCKAAEKLFDNVEDRENGMCSF